MLNMCVEKIFEDMKWHQANKQVFCLTAAVEEALMY